MRNQLSAWWRSLLHLIFPQLCLGCGQPLIQKGTQLLCYRCDTTLNHHRNTNIYHNKCNEKLAGRVQYEEAFHLYTFSPGSLIQHLIHQFKYQNEQELGNYFGNQMGEIMQRENFKPDYILPVPLHPKKEGKRGFNQAYLIAQGISKITGIPVQEGLILRTTNNTSQTTKNRMQRFQNVSNVFLAIPTKLPDNSHVLIVDDVLTTGATLEACILAIQQSSSCRVSVATVALAEK